MTKREKFIYNKFKESQILFLIMENNEHYQSYFVKYDNNEINFLYFVLTKDDYIIPRLITLKEFLSLYNDDDILAAILRVLL